MAEDDSFWTQERTRRLARELEAFPCLWDKYHQDYKKRVVKHDSRVALAQCLEVSVSGLEAKLKSVISQFRREIQKEKKIKTGSGGGQRYKSKWYLLPELLYLLTPAEIRETHDSMRPEDVCIETHRHNDELQEMLDEAGGSANSDTIESIIRDEELEDSVTLSTIDTAATAPSAVPSTSTNKSTMKRALDDGLTKAVTALATSLAQPSDDTSAPQDEWDLLGCLVASKIRRLTSRALQIKVESEIHASLFQAQADDAGCGIVYVSNNNDNLDNTNNTIPSSACSVQH